MTKINSTLGFLFSSDLKQVLLIEKQKPEFHKGLLNGLGGKVEKGEDEFSCIVREVEEESGIVTKNNQWQKIGILTWTEWNVEMFAAVYSGEVKDLESKEELLVAWYFVDQLPNNCVTNLYWLIPYCLDILKTQQNIQITIHYQ